jgi:hypothetical protein
MLTAPAALWWLLLAAGAAVLYLIRPRPRLLRTATLPFFRATRAHASESPWLQRFKRFLSWLITALVIALAAIALARPVAEPRDGLRTVIVLIDRSASMLATDADGRTRVQAAVDEARRRLDGLGEGAAVAVVAHDRRAEVVLARSRDRRAVERALAGLEARPVGCAAADAEAARALARALASAATPAEVWDLGDAPASVGPATAAAAGDGVAVVPIPVALPEPVNVGITAADLRRLPLEPDKAELFVQIHAVSAKPIEAVVEVKRGAAPVGLRSITLAPGSVGKPTRERLVLPVSSGTADALLTVTVLADGDRLAIDDRVEIPLPARRMPRVLLVGTAPDPFLTLALSGLVQAGAAQVATCTPAEWKPGMACDVIVACGWLPPPGTAAGLVLIDPPAAFGPLMVVRLAGPTPVDAPRSLAPGHPVLYGVSSARLSLSQTAALGADSGLEPLWSTPAGAALMAGEIGGRRVVASAAAPASSERLALTAAWPLLVGNAVAWCAQPAIDTGNGRVLRTGTVVDLRGTALRFAGDPPASGGPASAATATTFTTEIIRPGAWTTDGGDRGCAILGSSHETLLPAPPSGPAAAGGRAGWGGNLAGLLLTLLVGLLIAEAWLMHRKSVA